MLKHLTIKNYALIRHLELEPSSNLNVITGETGAGKSIMLGAVGLLLGNRADTKVLWNEEEKCIIEGTFDVKPYRLKKFFKAQDLDYDDTTVVRREISPGGKSRAFINDTPVTLEVMKKLGNLLMDVHSQHETLQLADQTFQLQLIDAFAQNADIIENYDSLWNAFLSAKKEFQSLQKQAQSLREEADYINFQLDELVKANLDDIDQEALESELKVMEHAEEIKNRLNAALEILTRAEINVSSGLSDARANLQQIADYSSTYENLRSRLESVKVELADLCDEIEKEEENVEFDPEKIESIKESLSNLYRLQKKHKVITVKELVQLRDELQSKATLTGNLDEELLKKEKAFNESKKQLDAAAKKLTDSRKKIFEPLSKQITKLLKELGIPDANLAIEHKNCDPEETGADKIEILFSANKGITPKSLAQVASGGEFSRLMFCFKYVMAEKTAMPTLILDEIDNGISGEIAIKLGNLMLEMSRKHQLITITHLPQIAAKGDEHYFVFKDNTEKKTVSSIRRLSEEDRVEQIAKMIGGDSPSKVALQNAKELLIKS